MTKYQIGDVVRLKSKGPDMTVERVDDDSIHCIWAEGIEIGRGTFSEEVLELVKAYIKPDHSIDIKV